MHKIPASCTKLRIPRKYSTFSGLVHSGGELLLCMHTRQRKRKTEREKQRGRAKEEEEAGAGKKKRAKNTRVLQQCRPTSTTACEPEEGNRRKKTRAGPKRRREEETGGEGKESEGTQNPCTVQRHFGTQNTRKTDKKNQGQGGVGGGFLVRFHITRKFHDKTPPFRLRIQSPKTCIVPSWGLQGYDVSDQANCGKSPKH